MQKSQRKEYPLEIQAVLEKVVTPKERTSMDVEILPPEDGILYRVRFASKGPREGESEIVVKREEEGFTL